MYGHPHFSYAQGNFLVYLYEEGDAHDYLARAGQPVEDVVPERAAIYQGDGVFRHLVGDPKEERVNGEHAHDKGEEEREERGEQEGEGPSAEVGEDGVKDEDAQGQDKAKEGNPSHVHVTYPLM